MNLTSILSSQKNDNRVIYHYTRNEIAIENIFNTTELQFSQLKNGNDPIEFSKFQHIGLNQPKELIEALKFSLKHEEINKQIDTIIKRNFHFASFCEDSNSGMKTTDNTHRGFSKARMWAQYSDNHSGVCIAIDKQKLLDCIRSNLFKIYDSTKFKLYSDKIKYVYNPYEYYNNIVLDSLEYKNDGFCLNHIINNINTYIFSKLYDYKDEDEYRVAIYFDNPKIGRIRISIKNAIIGVIIGAKCPNVYNTNYNDIARKNNIEVKKIKWENGIPSFSQI